MSKSFVTNTSGSVAIMAGLGFTMIAVAAGAAVDYSMATKNRHTLQRTVDAAALGAAAMLGADAATRMDRARALYDKSKFCESNNCSEATITMDGDAIAISASANVDTSLLRVAGIPTVRVDVMAKAVPVTATPVEVAMILDYSGSMDWDNKYQSMAAAATQFLDSAEDQPAGNLSVALVPFSEYVLTPMSGTYLFDIAQNTFLGAGTVVGCVLNRMHPHSTTVDTPSSAITGSLWPVTSYTVGGNPSSSAVFSDPLQLSGDVRTDTYVVMDGGINYEYSVEITDTTPGIGETQPEARLVDTGGSQTVEFDGHGKFQITATSLNGSPPAQYLNLASPSPQLPFPQFGGYGDSANWDPGDDSGLPPTFSQALLQETLQPGCGQYATNKLWVRPLTDAFDDLKDAIADMRPIGLTNIALALDLGWHVLTPAAPFTDSEASGAVERVAILLTDGVQTVAAHGGDQTVSIVSANSNIAESCEAMKADDIEIYTIAFDMDDAYTRGLLKQCASGEPNYFEPSQGGDLDDVFNTIFNKIISGQARLTG